jgi:hypothetical protein
LSDHRGHPVDGTFEWLIGWGIDLPRLNEPTDGHFMTVAGWFIGRDAAVTTIEIWHGLHRVTGVPVTMVRPDVAEHLDLSDSSVRTGFDVTFNAVGLPEAFEVTVCACLGDSAPLPFAILRGRRQPLRPRFRPALQPLSVTSLGRTGTTLVMQMLAEHPDVCVHRVFPRDAHRDVLVTWTVVGGPSNLRVVASRHVLMTASPSATTLRPRRLPEQAGAGAWLRGDALEDLAGFCQRNTTGVAHRARSG